MNSYTKASGGADDGTEKIYERKPGDGRGSGQRRGRKQPHGSSGYRQDKGAWKEAQEEPREKLKFGFKPYVFPDRKTLPRRPWLYGKHYLRGVVSGTIAAPGVGKSTAAVVEALEMAIGYELLAEPPVVLLRGPDRKIIRSHKLPVGPLRVAYFNGEETQDELDLRADAVMKHFNIDPDEVGDRLVLVSTFSTPMLFAIRDRDGTVRLNDKVITAMIEWCDENGIDVAFFDPLVSFHGLPENDTVAMDMLFKQGFRRVAGERTRSVELVIHPRKPPPGETETTVNDLRGASSQLGALRIARTVNRMSRDEAKGFGIKFDDAWQYLRLDRGKANPCPPGKATWRKLVPITLENGEEVATIEAWSPPKPFEDVTIATANAILDDIDSGLVDENGQPTGQRYSQHHNAKKRSVRPVVKKHMKAKTDADCTVIIRTWLKTGALEEREYHDPVTRKKDEMGLFVNAANRPGTAEEEVSL